MWKLKWTSDFLFDERDFLVVIHLGEFFQSYANALLQKNLCFLSKKHFNAFLILNSRQNHPPAASRDASAKLNDPL